LIAINLPRHSAVTILPSAKQEDFMNRLVRTIAVTGAILSAALSLASADDPKVVAGKASFTEKCQTCHNPEADRKTYGPSLVGIVGRTAGSTENYAYSEALKNSGIVWTEASLKAWMADNDGMLHGTRMRHVGVNEAAEQDMIFAYLKSLKD
jgi:cytochrome c